MDEFILISVSVIAGFLAGLVISEWSRKTTVQQAEGHREPYACPGCNGTEQVGEGADDFMASRKEVVPGSKRRITVGKWVWETEDMALLSDALSPKDGGGDGT